MARQYSTAVKDAKANAYETAVGPSPVMRFFTGSPPASCAAANTGTEVANGTLPSDWMGASSSATVAKAGTWTLTGIAAGTAGHYRLYASDGTTCHEQGTITATGGGGDLTLDNTTIAVSQTITINTWSRTQPD